MEVKASSVTDLFVETMGWAKVAPHQLVESRLGPCRVLDEPLTLCNTQPRNRVLINSRRNVNPFFQLMEAIWMFAGDDTGWITKFNKNMASFMDGKFFHGAYGYRWRQHFGQDQIAQIIKQLKTIPNSRRAYLGMWDPQTDLNSQALDLPCNVGMAFQVRQGKLNGYVFNRSNDVIWGMLGTNCVHFSFLLEVIADCVDLQLGSLYQMSANPHIYQRHYELLGDVIVREDEHEPSGRPTNAMNWQSWTTDAELFLQLGSDGEYMNEWFNAVASPMYDVYVKRLNSRIPAIHSGDWRNAARLWVQQNRGHHEPC